MFILHNAQQCSIFCFVKFLVNPINEITKTYALWKGFKVLRSGSASHWGIKKVC